MERRSEGECWCLVWEQEEKLQRVRGSHPPRRRTGLEVKLVESAIQSMEELQMVLYLQVALGEGSGRPPVEGLWCTGKPGSSLTLWLLLHLWLGASQIPSPIFP